MQSALINEWDGCPGEHGKGENGSAPRHLFQRIPLPRPDWCSSRRELGIPVLGFHQDGLTAIIEGLGCGKKLNPTFMQLLEQTDPCNLRIGKNSIQQMIVVHRLDSFPGMKSGHLPLADGDVNDLVWTGAIPTHA